MNLLKIGMLNIHQDRWLDALGIFDELYVVMFAGIEEELTHNRIKYIKFDNKDFFNRVFLKFYSKMKKFKFLSHLNALIIFFLRLKNYKFIKMIKNLDFNYVHCSYSDWDDSGLLLLILKKNLDSNKVTRAYKETRPGYNYDELNSLKFSQRIVFNDIENQKFMERKYGTKIFNGKNIVTGIDEDYRKHDIISTTFGSRKLSEFDGKKHVVILAGKVFSDPFDSRSGSRLFYLSMIKDFIEKGFIVHLDTLKIHPDKKGVDCYSMLANEFPNKFIIEPTSNFKSKPYEAYENLSRYDYGVLHNFIEGSKVSEFDKVNIPNRFYEYQIAQVTPIIKRGTTILLEKIINEKKCGVIYDTLDDLNKNHNVSYFKPSFKDYIEALYNFR